MTNTEPNFLEQRRQALLTEGYTVSAIRRTRARRPMYLKEISSEPDSDAHPGILSALANDTTDLLHLRYTAGESIETLPAYMDEVVNDWEADATAAGVIGANPQGSIFGFGYRVDYTRAVLLVGLAILLGRSDLLGRIDALVHSFKGTDAVYEELVSPYLPDRPFTDTWYHHTPYETALNAIDSSNSTEQSELMGKAVAQWYSANEGEPFYDTHKNIDSEGNGGYAGYWCFELAALCFIKGIDDSSFRHQVTYPKDLVDFARAQQTKAAAPIQLAPASGAVLSATPGQACPKAGIWFCPNLENRELRLSEGDAMPGPHSGTAGNAVIWYWKRS